MVKKRRPYALIILLAFFAVAGWFYYEGTKDAGRQPKRPEAGPRKKPSPEKPPVKPKRPEAKGPVAAIIIDDLGQDPRIIGELVSLGVPVSVAVMPGQRYSERIAREAREAGFEVLLHLPMQPKGEPTGLGTGALTLGMTEDEVAETLKTGLSSVPGATGVNNHMGSGLTCDREAMDALMPALKARGLFFVDSRTTPESVACHAASDAGVKSASRDVFLDDSNDPDEIRRQFARFVKVARKNGRAIAIGHPRPATLGALRELLPGLAAEGIKVVKVSELVR